MGPLDFEVGKGGVVDVEAAAMMYERIVLALRPEGEAGEQAGPTVQLAWSDLLPLLPDSCVTDAGRKEANLTRKIEIGIDDLYEQLRHGRVTVPVGRLVRSVPPQWVTAHSHVEPAPVDLPLRLVVKAVPRGELRGRTAQQARAFRMEGLPNLFERAPDAPATEPQARVAPSEASGEPSDAVSASEPRIPVRLGLRQRGAAPVLPPLGQPLPKLPDVYPSVSGVDETVSADQITRLTEAVSAFKDIESALGGKPDAAEELPSIELSFEEILKIVPASYVAGGLNEADRGRIFKVVIEDLYQKLSQGRVAIPVSQLIFAVPRGLLDAKAFEDASLVVLPLPIVVRAVGPARLAGRIRGRPSHYRTEELPDLFAAKSKCAEDSAGEPGAEASAVLVEGAEAEALGGINLNTSSAEQLQSLPGVTPRLAAMIVAYREEHGPFKDVFDLHKVPRVGRKTFRAITGMAHSGTGRHRRLRLAALLKLPAERAAHLPTIAGCLAAMQGFSGCIISDADGLLLASAGADRWAVETSAVIPRLVSRVSENMREVGAPTTEALTILSQGRMFTVVPGEHIFVTAIHEARRLTAAQLRHVQRVACELQWLISRRGYV